MLTIFIAALLLLTAFVLVLVWLVFDEDRALVGAIACLSVIAGIVVGRVA